MAATLSKVPRSLLVATLVGSAVLTGSLLVTVDDATASCNYQQEWRWVEWWSDDCCMLEYPPGYYSWWVEKFRRQQYREYIDCRWTAWRDYGPIYGVCSTANPKCPVAA